MADENKKDDWATSYSLLNRLKDTDDHESWKEFINKYEQYIYNIIRRFKISPADADDLSQIVIIKLWKELPNFQHNKNRGKFRSWLATVIRNETMGFLRSSTRRNELLSENNDYVIEQVLPNNSEGDIDKIIEDEWALYVSNKAWECVQRRFKETAQKVFILTQEGKSTQEIADLCGIKTRTVYKYQDRIKQSFKEEIRKINDEFI